MYKYMHVLCTAVKKNIPVVEIQGNMLPVTKYNCVGYPCVLPPEKTRELVSADPAP